MPALPLLIVIEKFSEGFQCNFFMSGRRGGATRIAAGISEAILRRSPSGRLVIWSKSSASFSWSHWYTCFARNFFSPSFTSSCSSSSTRYAVSAAELAQAGGYANVIVDQKMVDASTVIAGYMPKGYTTQGDTYADLAKAMGVPEDVLPETMEKWNAAVAAGTDE